MLSGHHYIHRGVEIVTAAREATEFRGRPRKIVDAEGAGYATFCSSLPPGNSPKLRACHELRPLSGNLSKTARCSLYPSPEPSVTSTNSGKHTWRQRKEQ